MPFYQDSQTLYSVMNDLFSRVLANPALLKPMSDGRVALRMTLSAPDAVLTLDGRTAPVRFTTGAASGPTDIALRMSADTLHGVWLGQVRLRDAFTSGAIKLESSPLRALSLLGSLTEMFRYVENLYADVLRQRGML